jgi:hypothetical protein
MSKMVTIPKEAWSQPIMPGNGVDRPTTMAEVIMMPDGFFRLRWNSERGMYLAPSVNADRHDEIRFLREEVIALAKKLRGH